MDKIDIIRTTKIFLNYNDYLEIYNELDDEKIKLIINNYKELINNSLIENIDDYIRLEMLRFWKDFFCLFYLALFFIKEYYKSNSIIISLGESPAKLVFTQSLFYNDYDIYNKLKLKNYPINLNFKYLPLSGLSLLLLTYSNGNRLRPFTEIITKFGLSETKLYNYDDTIKLMNSNYDETIEYNFKNYILKADLDPLKIINSDKNIIIIDRAEGMTTLATFFYLYSKLTTFQNLTSAQKNIFFCKFNFIGFDCIINRVDIINQNTKIINNVKSFIKNLLEIDDIVLEKMIKIKMLRFDNCKREEIINYIKQREYKKFYRDNYMNLDSIYNTLITLINILTVPENYDLSSRCIKSYSLINDLPDKLLTDFKQTNKQSVNCNFINFIIFLIFMKLKKTDEFDKLINNIDDIHEYSFFKDTKTDIPIDKFLESLVVKQKFIDFFIDNPQIISKTIFNDEITFSYEEIFNKDKYKNKYLKYKNKYLKYKK
jgi:hypothetical protein